MYVIYFSIIRIEFWIHHLEYFNISRVSLPIIRFMDTINFPQFDMQNAYFHSEMQNYYLMR